MKIKHAITLSCFIGTLLSASWAQAETLDELKTRTHYHGIAFARSGSASLLLATHHGIFAVDEKGQTTEVSATQDFMGFSASPTDPLTYFASGHPHTGGNSGFLKSVDGGSTWTKISTGANGPVDFHQMDVSAVDPQTIYGNYGALQVSHDGGQSWAITGQAPDQLVAIATSGVIKDVIYAATQQGLFVSRDGGANWTVLAFKGEVVSLAKAGPNGQLLAFVLGKGLMATQEAKPDQWESLNNNFGEAIPLHLAINPKNAADMVLTTQENDILRSTDSGTTWTVFAK